MLLHSIEFLRQYNSEIQATCQTLVSRKTILPHLHLYCNENCSWVIDKMEKNLPTYGSILIFDCRPQRELPETTLKVYIFEKDKTSSESLKTIRRGGKVSEQL